MVSYAKNITNLYILVDPDKPHTTKLGITKDPEQRIKAYRTAAPHSYFLIVYSNVDKKHEKKLISIIKDIATITSEFIRLPPEMVKNIVDCYFNEINE